MSRERPSLQLSRRAVVLGGPALGGAALISGAALGGLTTGCKAQAPSGIPQANSKESTVQSSTRMPALFLGHGTPMNAIEDNRWSRSLAALGPRLPKPKAILAISAHWFINGTYLTGDVKPETIHDFRGFPQPLYEVQYPAPGQVDLAQKISGLLGERSGGLRTDWGLDHGTWSVLRWMWPEADVPVIQLSIDRRMTMQQHLDLGRSLAGLREEGVMIIGSGNIVHNLRDAFGRMRSGSTETPPWARRFDDEVKKALTQRDDKALVKLWETEAGQLSQPSPDHWIPMLYTYAVTDALDALDFPVEGFDYGSLSMRSVRFGA